MISCFTVSKLLIRYVVPIRENLQTDILLSFPAGDYAYADAWLKEESQGFLPNTSVA